MEQLDAHPMVSRSAAPKKPRTSSSSKTNKEKPKPEPTRPLVDKKKALRPRGPRINEMPYEIRLNFLCLLENFHDLSQAVLSCKALNEPYQQHPKTILNSIAPQHFGCHWKMVLLYYGVTKLAQPNKNTRLPRLDRLLAQFHDNTGAEGEAAKLSHFKVSTYQELQLRHKKILYAEIPFVYPKPSEIEWVDEATMAKAEKVVEAAYVLRLIHRVGEKRPKKHSSLLEQNLGRKVIRKLAKNEAEAKYMELRVRQYANERFRQASSLRMDDFFEKKRYFHDGRKFLKIW